MNPAPDKPRMVFLSIAINLFLGDLGGESDPDPF
jgi:hypothetical protein